MNTYAGFHRRMLRSEHGGHIAYDIAMRTTSGYEPDVWFDARLNQTLYTEVARAQFLGPSSSANFTREEDRERLKLKLFGGAHSFGDCARDRSAFICHPFAEPMERKRALGEHVARGRRARLQELLKANQQPSLRTLADVLRGPAVGAASGGAGAEPFGHANRRAHANYVRSSTGSH